MFFFEVVWATCAHYSGLRFGIVWISWQKPHPAYRIEFIGLASCVNGSCEYASVNAPSRCSCRLVMEAYCAAPRSTLSCHFSLHDICSCIDKNLENYVVPHRFPTSFFRINVLNLQACQASLHSDTCSTMLYGTDAHHNPLSRLFLTLWRHIQSLCGHGFVSRRIWLLHAWV